jgi:hypothetical protein
MHTGQEKIRVLLSNSLVLSLLPAILIIILLPLNRERYLLEEVSLRRSQEERIYFYEDVTGDGYAEEIYVGGEQTRSGLVIQGRTRFPYGQWNFRGEVRFSYRQKFWVVDDFFGSGNKELFLFTISNDSIFLHGLKSPTESELFLQNRLIARVRAGRDGYDALIVPMEPEDLNGDGVKELLFGIGTGYSVSPRQVYAYYILQDSLVNSPPSAYNIRRVQQADLTGDGRREIIIQGSSTGNAPASDHRFHDQSNWLMVLDQHLEFLFEPVEIPRRYSAFQPYVIWQEGMPQLVGIHNQSQEEPYPSFFRFSQNGDILSETGLPAPHRYTTLAYNKRHEPVFGITTNEYNLQVYDAEMQLIKSYPGRGFVDAVLADLNGDGHKEIIAANMSTGKVHVFRPGFRRPVSRNVEWNSRRPIISVRYRGEQPAQISMQLGNNHYLFDYGRNPWYYANFLIYLGVYLAVIAFTHGVRKVQRNMMVRERDTEKKITELQLSLVKNQLDPHFSLNALNSVMHAVRNNQPEVAEEGLTRFAALYRNMLLSAGSIRQSLEEELRFTENYLELEKMRFGRGFDYEIVVEPGVKLHLLVPKLLIQLHAENAVKHGLSPLASGGRLLITLSASDYILHLKIEDNGVGRAHPTNKKTISRQGIYAYTDEKNPAFDDFMLNSGNKTRENPISTGRGLALMEEFYDLYRKFYNQIIESEIIDLVDESGKPAGTSVNISMDLSNDPQRS